jgi:hypothetical protein
MDWLMDDDHRMLGPVVNSINRLCRSEPIPVQFYAPSVILRVEETTADENIAGTFTHEGPAYPVLVGAQDYPRPMLFFRKFTPATGKVSGGNRYYMPMREACDQVVGLRGALEAMLGVPIPSSELPRTFGPPDPPKQPPEPLWERYPFTPSVLVGASWVPLPPPPAAPVPPPPAPNPVPENPFEPEPGPETTVEVPDLPIIKDQPAELDDDLLHEIADAADIHPEGWGAW